MSEGFVKTLIRITFWTIFSLSALLIAVVLLLVFIPKAFLTFLLFFTIGAGLLTALFLLIAAAVFFYSINKKAAENE